MRGARPLIRAGVDAWNLPGDRRGIGRHVRALLAQWNEHFADRIEPVLIVPEWHTWTVAAKYRDAAGSLPLRVRSRHHHGRSGLHMIWFPFNGPSWSGFTLPSVATLHDASTFALPGFGDDARATFRLAAKRCDRFITDSEFSKKELIRELRLDEHRITAVPLGVAPAQPDDRGAPLPVSGRFALFVGETEPRKGYDTLVEALRELQHGGLHVPLVIAGKVLGPLAEYSGAQFLGQVDDKTLAALYRDCAVFVYPSRYEGFGLPVLEAMSYGAPVVASSAGAIPEAGGDAALYVPAGDVRALAQALRRVWTDTAFAAELRSRGLRRVTEFPWRRTAERTLEIFEEVASP